MWSSKEIGTLLGMTKVSMHNRTPVLLSGFGDLRFNMAKFKAKLPFFRQNNTTDHCPKMSMTMAK